MCERAVVRHEGDATPRVTERGQEMDELSPRAAILAECRLVEHEERRRRRQRGGDRQAPLLAAGEGERIAAARCVRRSRSRSSSARRPATSPLSLARFGPSRSSSRTEPVRNWCSGSWKTVPIRPTRSRAGQPAIGSCPCPAASASPAITRPIRGASSPAIISASVDLPLPFGPVIASASAERTERSTFAMASAAVPGYRKPACSTITSADGRGRSRRGGAAGG